MPGWPRGCPKGNGALKDFPLGLDPSGGGSGLGVVVQEEHRAQVPGRDAGHLGRGRVLGFVLDPVGGVNDELVGPGGWL